MTDTDDRIDAALRAEEERLLAQIGEEPGFFSQAVGLFRARNAWVNWTMMIAQTALFIAGAYAAWRFFEAGTTLDALRWGLPSAVLLLMSLIIKLSLWPIAQINLLREDIVRLFVSSKS
ncbi:DUF6768 family protein [Brevundimonas aveniformis]|mgnify:FL=1|uniref:DUF6768 family protein n=1 Tax=Brevundimonas aveniformis TaxID=370977 RepID=UPI0024909B36|nr:DUF6768 family protein [Brevundimonas aveniformis]